MGILEAMRARSLRHARRVLLAGLWVLWSTTAAAAPTISLIWTDHSGDAVTGRHWIDAVPGDTVRLLITVHADEAGLSFASVSLSWDPDQYIVLDAVECPSPENAFGPGTCTDGGAATLPTITPFAPGVFVHDALGTASSFDAGGIVSFSNSIILGAIEFEVAPAARNGLIEVDYTVALGLDSVNDGSGTVYFPTGHAFLGPEPGTAALLSLGLVALGIARRRRG